MKKIIITTGIAVCTLASAVGVHALADEKANTEPRKEMKQMKSAFADLTNEQQTAYQDAMKAGTESALGELVTAGTITEEQADLMTKRDKQIDKTTMEAIRSAKETALKSAANKLVSAGTITQEQADQLTTKSEKGTKVSKVELTDAQQTALHEEVTASMETALADLVSKGTITKEQADQFSGKGKIKGEGSSQEALRTAQDNATSAALTELVSAGTISQDEAYKYALGHQGPKGSGSATLTTALITAIEGKISTKYQAELNSLVTAGTITQEQADQIIASKKAVPNQEQMEAIKSATAKVQETVLADLVSKGTLTQEQADSLRKMPAGMGNGSSKHIKAGHDRDGFGHGQKDGAFGSGDIEIQKP